jgi:predicted amidohydrolase
MGVPPEEFGIERGARDIRTCNYCFHEVVTKTLDAQAGATAEVVLRSTRFLDLKALGWVSGDTHVHWTKNSWDQNEDLALLAMVQRAEDLRVVNNLTLYQYRAPEAGGPFTKPDPFPMGPVPGYCDGDYHLQMAEEYRNDNFYGHLNLLGLTQLIEPLASGPGSGGGAAALDWPHNRSAIEACHRQGGIAAEAHGFGPCENGDAAVNAVLGLSDLMDQLDTKYYYLLLNAGARVPLGNGSDHPARVAGSARLYARVEGAFSYAGWLDGIRAGRTFVTSGPLLFLSVNGQDIGARLDLKPGSALVVEARAVSRRALGRLQIVANGQVLQEVVTAEREARLRLELVADRPRWFAARCAPGAEFAAIRTAEDEYAARPDVAHTSAIYVDVAGKPAFDPAAAQELAGRFRAHAEDIAKRGNFAADSQRRQAVAHVEAATAVLEQRLAAQSAAAGGGAADAVARPDVPAGPRGGTGNGTPDLPDQPAPERALRSLAAAAPPALAPIPHRQERVKVATVQVPIEGEALRGRDPADVIAPYIERAGREGADLVVFPEFTLGLFDLNGALHTKVSAAARQARVNVIVGGWEMLAGFDPKAVPFTPRTYANCALVIARDGALVGHYHKAHAAVGAAPYCWPPRPGEAGEWTMKWGEELPIFDLDIGRIGVLTCYDGFFFPVFETLSLKGAEILVWINGRPGVEDYLIKAASFLTCTAVVTGNNAKGMGATICDYPANVLVRQEQPGEVYLSAEIDLGRLRRERRNNRMFHQRRPELYRDILQDWPVWEYYPELPAFEYPAP